MQLVLQFMLKVTLTLICIKSEIKTLVLNLRIAKKKKKTQKAALFF